MVDNREHPNDVKLSNGRQPTLRRSGEDFEAGNATRRDYPVQAALTAHGKFRVIEKPDIIEAYTISLVSLSTPAVGGNIFTSCLKLIATSTHSEQRIREYPTEIVVIPSDEGKALLGVCVLVKRFILFKQETSLFTKHNYRQDYFKPYASCHIRSVSVCETSLSNIVMFTTDNTKPCYLADENNQCDCRQFLEQIPGERQSEKPCELELKLCPQLISNSGSQVQVHVCMFCGQGFVGGNSCGKVCDDFLKKNLPKKCRPKVKQPKKKSGCCGCLRKKDKSEIKEKECEFRIDGDKTERLFSRMNKPSEVYIKKPCLAKEQSLNVISCQKTLRPSEELGVPARKSEYIRQSYSPSIHQDPECTCRLSSPYQLDKPCPQKCTSPCQKKTCRYQSVAPCGYPLVSQEEQSPPYRRSSVSPEKSFPPCGHPSIFSEKLNPPRGHPSISPEKLNPTRRYIPSVYQERQSHECRCEPPISPDKMTPRCSCNNDQPICHEKPTPQEKAIPSCCCKSTPPVCQQKVTPTCSYTPAPPVCQEKMTLNCGCSLVPGCKDKAACVCRNLFKSTSKTHIKDFIYKSKSEKLVGKRFHLLCQKFESSEEETDNSTWPDKPKSPPDKIDDQPVRKLSSQESSELSEDVKNDDDDNKNKTETKVGRVEINYCKSYNPFKARLQRDNVPFRKRNDSLSTNSSSKPKHSASSTNSNFSYLNIRRKKSKRSKIPVKFEDCRSCYLKVRKHGNKKKSFFCYSSGCSIKQFPNQLKGKQGLTV